MTQRLAVFLTFLNLVLLAVTLSRTVLSAPQAAPAGPTMLRGEGLEIVDSGGKVRASIRVEQPDGQLVFRLADQEETVRVKLGADRKGSGLVLLNDTTEPGVHMLAKDDGTIVTLANKGGQQREIKP